MEGITLLVNEKFVSIPVFDNYLISNMGRCYNTKTKRFVGSADDAAIEEAAASCSAVAIEVE